MRAPVRRSVKKTAIIISIFILVITAIQLVGPVVSNPPVTGKLTTPAAVTQVFERACYDCHSNETKLEWYDKIAPVSWKVAADVHEARSRFNLSEWDKLSAKEQEVTLWKMVNAVIAGKMPLQSYTLVHPAATIPPTDMAILKAYLKSLHNNRPADATSLAATITAANNELQNYRHKKTRRDTLPVALNGVRYIDGYQQWQVISTTNRFDNYTIRVVYGNAITVKAIKENYVHPFPDGAAIVKVVWNKIADSDGVIRPGTFNAVQIMVKDNKKYPDTGGWGFAIFNGQKLIPTGKTAGYAITCFNCHKQMASGNGYVFNVPLTNRQLNNSYGPPDTRELFDAGNQQVITSFANEKKATLSVLYGNQAAQQFSLDTAGHHVAGEVFTLVTWEQVDHPNWYGSQMNGRLQTIEKVSVLPSPGKDLSFHYSTARNRVTDPWSQNTADPQERIKFILTRLPSVFP